MPNKNILIIIHHLCRGGAEKSAAVLSKSLSDMGHNVTIVTFFSNDDFPATYPYNGQLICLNNNAQRSKWANLTDFFKRIYHIRRIKKKHHITTSISFLFGADIANILSDIGEYKIVSIRSALAASKISVYKQKLLSFFYQKADCITVQNERIAQDMSIYFGIDKPKYQIIPNFYTTDVLLKQAYAALSQNEIGLENTNYKILYQIGRLYEPKGQWHLFRIFANVLKKQPSARLVIAGEGELRDFLIKYAADLNLNIQVKTPENTIDLDQYHIVLLGYTQEPHKYLQYAQLFLLTSLYEGFPNALAEAMICGKMVLSTDCKTGPRELIAPELIDAPESITYPYYTDNGVLLPTFDGKIIPAHHHILAEEQIWTDCILANINNNDLQNKIGRAAANRMLTFDYKNVIQIWESLLK